MYRLCKQQSVTRQSRKSAILHSSPLFATIALVLCSAVPGLAQTKRLVVLKCDGLPPAYVDRGVRERDPRTGKSQLPWIEHVFYQRGTRLENFYVRGLSLSAPSWSLLETGQHLQIKGNVEFDRYTLQSYDYLNFIPFFIARIGGVRVDMPAVEVLDSSGHSNAYRRLPAPGTLCRHGSVSAWRTTHHLSKESGK